MLSTSLLAGCTFRGIGRAGEVILVRNDRDQQTNLTIQGSDLGSGETLLETRVAVASGRADTVPDPLDDEDATGRGVLIEVETSSGLADRYEWVGGAGADVQQLQITVEPDAIVFSVGAPTLPETTDG